MNFNFKTFSILLAGAALGLTACQNDVLSPDASNSNGDEYTGRRLYVSAGITLPNSPGTRSHTDDLPDPDDPQDGDDHNKTNSDGNGDPNVDDFEYGYDYENDVRTMILVFATGSSATTDDSAGGVAGAAEDPADGQKNEDQFLCYSVVSGIEKAPTGADYSFEVLAEVKYDDLKAAYEKNIIPTSGAVRVYAYCNYTANLENVLKNIEVGDTDWLDETGKITEGPSGAGQTPDISSTIWAKRSFLMTSARVTETKFPKQLDGEEDGWDKYADKSSPFKVTKDGTDNSEFNPIKVERSAARIDFRDASNYTDNGNKVPNTYAITTDVHKLEGSQDNGDQTQGKDEKNLFSIQLTHMALVNMSNEFYYLRRVAPNYEKMADAVIGGIETATGGANPFVVDVDWEEKNTPIKASNANQYFNFCLFNSTDDQYGMNQWYIDDISDVTKGTEDTWEGSQNNRYHIWRYVTENTLPTVNDQIVVQSTGVVFKGRIIGGKDVDETYDTQDEDASKEYYVSAKVREALKTVNGSTPVTNPENLPILYSFEGFLFAGWEELIERAAKDGVGGTLYTAVNNILKNWVKGTNGNYTLDTSSTGDSGTETKEVLTVDIAFDLLKDKENAKDKIDMIDEQVRKYTTDQNITVYEVSKEDYDDGYGYYCYYFYWIRHNDNDKSGLMGPMEFAVVRNNVYKLYVNSINRFGHPRDPKDDPDPEKEDTPDEKPTRYIEVMIDVLPWVVRENKIDF